MKKILWTVALLATMISVSGCMNDATPTSKPQTKASTQTEDMNQEVTLTYYKPTEDILHLVPETKKLLQKDATPKRAVEEMILADSRADYPLLPKHLTIKEVSVSDGVATVDFSPELNRLGRGSTEEEFFIQMTVYTLTEFPDIHEVRFLMNGAPISSFSGHYDMTRTFQRNPNLLKK